MSVEFKVVRLGEKVVSVSTDSPHLEDWTGELPLVSVENGSSSVYQMPDDHAKHHYTLLLLQK